MNVSTRFHRISALATLCLSLVACGGGGSGGSAPATTPLPPTAPTAYVPDLRSFAVAWTSLVISEFALDVLHISAETGNCGVSGSTSYDVGSVKQTLSLCVTKSSPASAYTGQWSATSSVSGSLKTVTMSSPAITVADATAPAQAQYAITAGNVSGVDDFSSSTADVYTAVGFSLDALVGPANSSYRVGSNAPGSASQSVQNGVSTTLIKSAALGVSHAGNAWRYTVDNVRSVGDNRPDQGTIIVIDAAQPTTAATTITFGPGNSIVFASGGQSVSKGWADADVQAALIASR